MRHELQSIRQEVETADAKSKGKFGNTEDIVLEKNIFNNVFEKDIRRVFVYKKADRLAKALHLIRPAFADDLSLRHKLDMLAVTLVDTALLPPVTFRVQLPRELLGLLSLLGVARTSGLLSAMNTELLIKEVQFLLQEVAAYEEPRLALEETPTLSMMTNLSKSLVRGGTVTSAGASSQRPALPRATEPNKGQIKDRKEAVLAVIRDKGHVSIKDISHLVRGVSEKTIQRELASLVSRGVVMKQGERRWSTYALA